MQLLRKNKLVTNKAENIEGQAIVRLPVDFLLGKTHCNVRCTARNKIQHYWNVRQKYI